MFENNQLISMKNFQKCKVSLRAYSISLDEVHQDLMQLSKLNEVSIMAKVWKNIDSTISEFSDLVSTRLRYLQINKSNIALLFEIMGKKYYLRELYIEYD